MSGVLTIWTITYNPIDYPGRYVVHGHEIRAGNVRAHDAPLVIADTLEHARASLPGGLFNIGRKPEDEPQIVESWV